jgi:uncharacterized protein (DUF2147 family)
MGKVMKRSLCTLMLFLFYLPLFAQTGVDPAEGYWQVVDRKTNEVQSVWEFYQQEGILYGRLVLGKDNSPGELAAKCRDSYPGFPVAGRVNQLPVLGTPWIFGLKRVHAGEWTGGTIINPTTGNSYKCKVIYHSTDGEKFMAPTLEIRGEIGLGIGASQYWQQANREEILNMR